MPVPDGVPTFTLVIDAPPLAADGAVRQGTFTFTPVPNLLADPAHLYTGVENATLDASGGTSKVLVANDALSEPFVWRVDGQIDAMPPFSVNISVPASAGTVNLGAVAEFEALPPDYVVIPGPQGPEGPAGSGGTGTPSSTVTSGTAFGQSSTAGTASTYSRGDHAHGTPAAPTLAGLGGLAKSSNLSDLASPSTARTNLGLGTAATQASTAFDAAGAAAAVSSSLTTHAAATTSVHGITDTAALVTNTDPRLTNNRTPSGTAGGDLSGTYPSPSVVKVAGITVTGTPAAGQVLTATSSTAASWQTPTGGGGGGVTPVWYIDDLDAGIIHLPGPTASWTPLVGSNSVAIARNIVNAVAGDVIEVDAIFLRIGASMQLDARIVVAGTPVRYFSAADATPATPGNEGEPAWYGGTSFKESTGTWAFILQTGDVGVDGSLRIEMVYRGTDIPADNSHTLYFGSSVGYRGRFTAKHWKIGAR